MIPLGAKSVKARPKILTKDIGNLYHQFLGITLKIYSLDKALRIHHEGYCMLASRSYTLLNYLIEVHLQICGHWGVGSFESEFRPRVPRSAPTVLHVWQDSFPNAILGNGES